MHLVLLFLILPCFGNQPSIFAVESSFYKFSEDGKILLVQWGDEKIKSLNEGEYNILITKKSFPENGLYDFGKKKLLFSNYFYRTPSQIFPLNNGRYVIKMMGRKKGNQYYRNPFDDEALVIYKEGKKKRVFDLIEFCPRYMQEFDGVDDVWASDIRLDNNANMISFKSCGVKYEVNVDKEEMHIKK